MNRITLRGAVPIAVLVLAAPALAAEDGPAIYKTKCVSCHGASGAGDTPMGKKLGVKDLGAARAQSLTDEELFDVISLGRNKMPAFEKRLAPEKIKQVVAYIRTLKRG